MCGGGGAFTLSNHNYSVMRQWIGGISSHRSITLIEGMHGEVTNKFYKWGVLLAKKTGNTTTTQLDKTWQHWG